jgi:hypothetical protein
LQEQFGANGQTNQESRPKYRGKYVWWLSILSILSGVTILFLHFFWQRMSLKSDWIWSFFASD